MSVKCMKCFELREKYEFKSLHSLSVEFSLFSFNNGMVVSSCRELDNNRSALSAASAFAIATAGANEGTPTKEKYRRMSLASTGQSHEGIEQLLTTYPAY